MSEDINLNQRPATYFGPQKLEDHLLSKVKNAVVRKKLQSLAAAGRDEEVRELLVQEGLSDEVFQSLETIHPMYMGGNYLDDTEEGEVEIARISIQSTTYDVTCVYARPADGLIRYRVVDEYDGETLRSPSEAESVDPMTLGELTDFFLQAWPLLELLDEFFRGDLQAQLDYFDATSEYYPQFGELCTQRAIECFRE